MTEGHPERGRQAESKDLALGNKIMWLPKDERKLLLGYYINIGNPNEWKWFVTTDWYPVMTSWGWRRVKRAARKVKDYDARSKTPYENQFNTDMTRINTVNRKLELRNLIKVKDHNEPPVKGISLTIEGYDLGRKYRSRLKRSGLWFAEYKDHWFWLILGFLGGIIGALIVNWLSSLFTKSPGC